MPRKFARLLVLLGVLACVMTLGACRDTGGEGKLFEISGKIFIFNYRVARATYVVTLNPLQPMQEGQVAVASFQNPAGGDPLMVEQKIWPKLSKVTLESPALTCVVKDKPYAISISIKNADGEVLQTIDTTLMSTEDQSVMPDQPLVVGPFYTPNPALAGHPDGKLPDDKKAPCPPA